MKKLIFLIFFCFNLQNNNAQINVGLYWDASYSMQNRNIDRELTFLDNYFKKNTEANVLLVMFSNEILQKATYKVQNADWTELKTELQQTIYDGSTSYSVLFKDKLDEYLLFTDGIENLDKLKPSTDKPIYIISSSVNVNSTNLELYADLSSGAYINLAYDFEKKKVKEKTKQISQVTNDGFVTGTISGVEGLLSNVSIINKNSNKGASSDTKGNFKILADEDDVLVFTYLGKKTVNIRVAKTNVINISMANINENLGEVVIEATVKKEELVNTGNDKVDKRSIGYDVQSISNEDISDSQSDVKEALKGQFAGLEIPEYSGEKKGDLSQLLGRGKNMTILGNQYGLIVVDGVPTAQSDSSSGGNGFVGNASNIDPQTIKSVTYLKGLAATNKYGTKGRNGVLLITTINARSQGDKVKKKIKLGTTETYSGDAESISALPDTPYIKKLKTSQTIEEAFDNYLKQRERYGNNPEFYLDVYDYFKGWKNSLLSNRVLSNVYEIAFDNSRALRALSYKQQATGNYEDAVHTLKQVVILKPKQSQSYRDLALAYTYAKQYKEALKLYKNIDKNIGVGNVILNGIDKSLTNDLKNLISLHGKELNTYGVNAKYLKPLKYKSRIVFEWNNLDSEFDLSIVNPQKRFFTWSHTNAENYQRISQEKQEGYGIEEYFLTNNDVGEWAFNMKYYGNNSKLEPATFIKITIYKDFGSPNQTKEIKVIKLDKKNKEQTVAQVNIK
jgi:hypothetical protein